MYNYIVIGFNILHLLLNILYATTYFDEEEEDEWPSRRAITVLWGTVCRVKFVIMPIVIILFMDIKDKFRSFSKLDDIITFITTLQSENFINPNKGCFDFMC